MRNIVIGLLMGGMVSSIVASPTLPYVTVAPIQKVLRSDIIASKATKAKEDVYLVHLKRDQMEDKQVNQDVELIQIGFDKRDLIKGKVVKTFLSKTIQTIVIKPLQKITGSGVVQARLNVEDDTYVHKIPLNALREAKGLNGTVYIVNATSNIVAKEPVDIRGFDGPYLLVDGAFSEVDWVVISGFHKIVIGEQVRISTANLQ